MIKFLSWDSNFFNKKIFAIEVRDDNIDNLPNEIKKLRLQGADLVYLFTCSMNNSIEKLIYREKAILYDRIITYMKEISNNFNGINNSNIIEYQGATEDLLELSFMAGHESRFKKDPLLQPNFKRLYASWIENSINGQMADKIFVHINSLSKPNAFVTCKINENIGEIGLIATDTSLQGKGIGKNLMQSAESFFYSKNTFQLSVVTQETNKKACSFYESLGFIKYNLNHVYHLWLTK